MTMARTDSVQLWTRLVDALTFEVCVVDAAGAIVLVNEAWRAFGRTNAGEPARIMEGVNYLEVCDRAQGAFTEGASEVAAGLRGVLAGSLPDFALEYPCPSEADPGRWFICQLTPFMVGPERLVAIAHVNISRQHAAEVAARAESQALGHAVEQLHAAEHDREAFLNDVSHELRTPLTAILGYAELLEDLAPGRLSPEQGAAVAQIVHAGERIEGLLDDLQELARQIGGTFRVRPTAQDLARLISEITQSMRPAARAAGISISWEAPEALPGIMDPRRIEQVLANLLSNAIKFSPHGSTVRVMARRTPEQLVVEVADEGEGIAPGDLPRLFHPFSQLEHGVRAGCGTGLGLSISKRIVEAHRGQIGVRSQPGAGSTFWFTLPAAPTSPPG